VKNPRSTTFAERAGWIWAHGKRHPIIQNLAAPVADVGPRLFAAIQHEFPSPEGLPIVGGWIDGNDVVAALRLRAFPFGAKVGRMTNGADRGNQLKPTFHGKLENTSSGSRLTYSITCRMGVYTTLGFGVLAALLLTTTVVVGIMEGVPAVYYPFFGTVACASAVWSLLQQTTRAMFEEGLLLEWLDVQIAPFRPNP
jgi:hypothetical protein